MALSGGHTGSKTYGFSTRIEWSATQSVANNTSTVTANLYLIIDSGWSVVANASKNGSITIDTAQTFAKTPGSLSSGKHLLGTQSRTITHNANGTKSISVSGYFDLNVTISGYGYVGRLSTGSQTYTLDTIPRASSFTLSGATQTNSNINVSISRKSTAFTHRVRWRVGSGSWTTASSSATTSSSFQVQPNNMANLKSATITVGVQTYSGTTAIGSEATATRTITIPNSTISLSGTANTGSTQTVSITNSGGSLSYTRSWKLGSATGTNSSTWTPPHSALPSATSGTLTCTVVTKNGTATINTTSATRTITVPTSVLPTFGSITHTEYVSDVNTKVGAYVQGRTRLTLGVTSPSAGSGSSIKSYSISVGGHTVSNGGTTPVITQSGTLTITAKVTDNRNRTVTKTDTISVLAYENPIVTGVSFTRSDSDGTPNTTGTHLTIKATIRVRRLIVSSVEKNKINYQSQSAQVGGSYTTKTDLASQAGTINGNYRESVYTHTFSGYPIDYPYNVRVRGGDIFSWSGYIAGGVPTGVVLQHWGEDTTAFGKMIDSTNYNVLVGTKGMKVDGPIIDKNGNEVSTPSWADISGKPSTFPPSSHTHSYLPLSGGTLTGNLAQSANRTTQVGSFVRLTSWANQLDGKAYNWHIHLDGTNALLGYTNSSGTRTTYNLTSHTHTWAQVTGKPSTFAPSSHTHTSAQLPNAFTALWSGNASSTGTRTMTSRSGYDFLIVMGFMDQGSSENLVSVTIPVATISTNARRYALSISYASVNSYIFFSFPSATQFRIDNVYGNYIENIQYIYGVKIT